MAYQSDESGHSEVYVRAYPGLGRKVQISAAGGYSPRWNRNGRELFYQTSSAIMAVAILDPQNLRVGAPVRLFPYAGGPYDVSPDGQRFLTMEQGATARSLSPLHLVQNWFEELKVRVPTK